MNIPNFLTFSRIIAIPFFIVALAYGYMGIALAIFVGCGVTDGLDGFIATWFSAGRLTWTTGANAGLSIEIKQHRVESGHAVLSLWQAMPEPIAAGDAFTVSAGCDKRLATCRDRFANSLNFRGFPHMPGIDRVAEVPVAGEGVHDGTIVTR